jgi:YebC/PmpR family DNA-binding regulatory protein
MSGHSKWATIKHQKGAKDAKRGKLFAKLARQIEVSAREGGADPASNATLRTAVLKAKAGQMTNEAIDRAIKRGAGTDDGGTYEAITYEGYAPGGVAMMVDTLTDNRNRTGSNIRMIFSKLGGSMAEPGAVGWQFSRKGVVLVDGAVDEDELTMAALDADADDVARDGPGDGADWKVLCAPNHVYDLQAALEAAGITVKSAESTMVSSIDIEVTALSDAKKILRIMDALEDDDDVQDVYSNFDISDELMEMAGE